MVYKHIYIYIKEYQSQEPLFWHLGPRFSQTEPLYHIFVVVVKIVVIGQQEKIAKKYQLL